MIIYDLTCSKGHRFEGWFQDLQAYQAQASEGQLSCPVCGNHTVEKAVTGSAIRRSGRSLPDSPVAAAPASPPSPAPTGESQPQPTPQQVREALGMLAAHIRANSEDVGPRFAQEARLIHTGEAPGRTIRGTTTPSEETELAEEGIPFLKLPMLSTDD